MKDFSTDIENMANDIYNRVLTYEDKNDIRKSSAWKRRRLNNGELGRLIRNRYKFWSPDNPLTNFHDKDSINFPDNLSAQIIEEIFLIVKRRWFPF